MVADPRDDAVPRQAAPNAALDERCHVVEGV
jgi:hypothetical protein